jgi:hypothetical protein
MADATADLKNSISCRKTHTQPPYPQTGDRRRSAIPAGLEESMILIIKSPPYLVSVSYLSKTPMSKVV